MGVVTGKFTATAQVSEPVTGREVDVCLGGYFSTRVVVQVKAADFWVPVEGGTLSCPGCYRFAVNVARPWRLVCDQYHTGDVAYELASAGEVAA